MIVSVRSPAVLPVPSRFCSALVNPSRESDPTSRKVCARLVGGSLAIRGRVHPLHPAPRVHRHSDEPDDDQRQHDAEHPEGVAHRVPPARRPDSAGRWLSRTRGRRLPGGARLRIAVRRSAEIAWRGGSRRLRTSGASWGGPSHGAGITRVGSGPDPPRLATVQPFEILVAAGGIRQRYPRGIGASGKRLSRYRRATAAAKARADILAILLNPRLSSPLQTERLRCLNVPRQTCALSPCPSGAPAAQRTGQAAPGGDLPSA